MIAMAGERLHPPGLTEISAVCTDAEFRGEGLATRLVLAIADGIYGRGETPFVHAAATNTNAIALYEHLGFVLLTEIIFSVVRSLPADRVVLYRWITTKTLSADASVSLGRTASGHSAPTLTLSRD